jgi:hypothetical protein
MPTQEFLVLIGLTRWQLGERAVPKGPAQVVYGNLNWKMRHISRKTRRPGLTAAKLREDRVLLGYMEKAQAREACMPEVGRRTDSELRVSA